MQEPERLSEPTGPALPAGLSHTLLDLVPLGVIVYRLDDPDDPGSLRLVQANEAASRAVGFDVQPEIGRTFYESLPQALDTEIPALYAEVARTGRPRDLGEIEYGDDRIAPSTFRVRAEPLPDRHVAVVFEDISERKAVEDRLRQQALRFRGVFDSAFQHIFLIRPDGTLLEANRTALDFAGTGQEAVLGEAIWQTSWWGRSDETRAQLRKAVERAAAGEFVRYVVDVQGAGTAVATLDLSIKPIQSERGPVELLIAEGRDITESVQTQRELHQLRQDQEVLLAEEARYRVLGETLDQQIWTADPDGRLDYVNRFVQDYFGRSQEEMIGEGWLGVVHPDDRNRVAERWERALETGEPYEVEFRLARAPDGEYRWHIGRATALRDEDGRIVKWFGSNTDIHQKKKAEELLFEANRVLEERVVERTSALAVFSEDLKALHRVTTAEHESHEDFLRDYIHTGRDIFEMPVGILSQTPFDEKTGEYRYRVLMAESEVPSMEVGWEAPLSDSFCDVVMEQQGTVSYADARLEDEAVLSKPPYAEFGLRSFIGTPIWVDGEIFGTLKFTSPEPREGGFAPYEHELIEVLAELVGRSLSVQRAERERAEADARYRSVVRTIEEGLMLVDEDGMILMINPAAKRMLGITEERTVSGRMVGTPRWKVIHEDGTPVPDDQLPEREALRTGRPVLGTVQGIVRSDGTTRWYTVNVRPAEQYESGNRPSVVVSFTDVTEQRKAEAELRTSEQQLRRAQAMAHVGSWRWDVADNVVTWSDELYHIFGVEADAFETTFENYMSRIHPDDRDELQALITAAVERQESYEINHRLVRPDGGIRYVHSISEVILDDQGRTVALQGTAQDVTERRKAEQNLKHYATALEERNAELEQFAYVASHDLQEPLRMVSSFLQLLQRRYEGELDETADEYIAYAVDGAKRMQILIQDLLAYSRVGTRGKPFEPVDMMRAAEVVLVDLGPALKEYDASVELDRLPTVRADGSQMRQLLQNLIANAIKFHGSEPPEVRVAAVRVANIAAAGGPAGGRIEPGWRFSVTDNGIGIAPEHAERIFQIFQRLHTRDEYEGTGIGLAMCKKIVERHGGQIWFESELGKGATFYFTLPDTPTPTFKDRVDD